ncbi:MAG TPA: S8 family peptidase [Gemmatimonadaceae bacterium]|nr:S8 family peptidase [Gemmatimonadaceae bacterium]
MISLGCTHATQTGVESPRPARPTFSAAGALLTRIGNSARGLFETQTVSLALDRIDQRDLPLDKTYRRAGTGRGVTVYVFDGGILDTHPELAGRVRKGYDAFPNDPKVCNAHGTAVAGAIAGKTLGVAPEAQLVDVKMVECSKLRGTINAIVDGTAWVIEDHRAHGGAPAVANWSFIADTASHIPQLDSAVARLRAAGIPVIVSAGNVEMNACRISPGNAEGAVVVGASAVSREAGSNDVVDHRAENTAFGPCVDLYAPGDSVLLPSFDAGQTPNVQLWNGTSMSTGYVSGAFALYFESHPYGTPDQALQYIRSLATPNVVRDTYSPFSWLLYVGPAREPVPSVAEVRAQLATARRP